MDVGFVIYEMSCGFMKLEYGEKHILSISCVREDTILNKGIETSLTKLAKQQLSEYFEGKRRVFDFPYKMYGTEFQKKVWNELCKIPYGETRSYKEVASAIGNPKASRAIGMANNKNPMMIVVPCHRVIGSNGSMVGYAGGLPMKEMLLELEK